MQKTENDDDLLPVEVNSLSDYAPHKLHLLLSIPIPIDVTTAPKRSSTIRSFFRSRSTLAQYEQKKSSSQQLPIKLVDMRFFIIRHGERVDRYFGSKWHMLAFDRHDRYRPYHRNFPPNLPFRSNKSYWALDTPLTSTGLSNAKYLGRKLASKHFRPTYVYSSPAMRCITTTVQILKGLGLENQIAIRIEPGLLELGAAQFGMNIFFQPMDWFKFGMNIDLSYEPIITHIPPFENETSYYLRSKYVIREIEKRHDDSPLKLHNILIIAHATSSETLTWDLIGKQPNCQDLYRLSLNIGYLQMVITERKRDNQLWSFKSKR